MTETALFTSPMARKKRVYGRYDPNTYRVLSSEAETIIPSRPDIQLEKLGYTNLLGQSSAKTKEYRKNKPNPKDVGFLRQDVALLNEPICDVHTKRTKQKQHKWWPNEPADKIIPTAPHTIDTTARKDYSWRGDDVLRTTRHSANPNVKPALGAVPVNLLGPGNGEQRLWQEGISYEHQFNCRNDPSYPIRAKRHGSFVWDGIAPKEAERMVQKYAMESFATNNGSSAKTNSRKTTPSATNIIVPSETGSPQVSTTGNQDRTGTRTSSGMPAVE